MILEAEDLILQLGNASRRRIPNRFQMCPTSLASSPCENAVDPLHSRHHRRRTTHQHLVSLSVIWNTDSARGHMRLDHFFSYEACAAGPRGWRFVQDVLSYQLYSEPERPVK